MDYRDMQIKSELLKLGHVALGFATLPALSGLGS